MNAADATSSTASPSDLKRVSSAADRRPGSFPMMTSPSSAWMGSGVKGASAHRDQERHTLMHGRYPTVDEEPHRRHGGGVDFARRRNRRSDRIDVHALFQPPTLEDGLRAGGHGGNDVRATHRGFRGGHRLDGYRAASRRFLDGAGGVP